ncbi:E3 ubiquitin-protein ligase SHPRH-like isoform X2 [Ctenocephalides felis]|uniref:E3 ubiquitin-protein ligase SHPRH-like isoform X2 n=1 Tax=Ctenocephalides felis TaxID=7515 RepID=UPI000E6E2D10|nr:E3 ubiquitin-protein ligase SHPRH-like isoform X2 [Ctenocephalides felis]
MSIYIGNIPIEPVLTLNTCINLFNKPKEIQITQDDCDNNLLVVSDSFKIDQKLRHVFMCIAETKGFEFDIVEPTESEKNVVYIKVIWKCDYIKCNAKLDSIINYFYKEQILANKEKTPAWKDKQLNAQDPNVIYEFLKKFHSDESISENIMLSVQHRYLRPTLRRYQGDAVRWMIHREYNEDNEDILNPLYIQLESPDGTLIYYSENLQYLTCVKPVVKSLPTGGILADEMGLGKSVEVLSLILMNPRKVMNWCDDKEDLLLLEETLKKTDFTLSQKQSPSYHSHFLFSKLMRKSNGKFSGKYTNRSLKAFYEKFEKKFKDLEKSEKGHLGLNFQCVCGKDQISDSIVQCIYCDKMQHFKCIYKVDLKVKPEDIHICPACWKFETKIVSGATLLVSPLALSTQWENEIRRHIKKNKLKYFVYRGIKHGWVSPLTLASYDIVLTTYNILQNEFYHSSCSGETSSRTGRYARRYDRLTSPLMFLQWWRICLDEGQMVDSAVKHSSQIAKCLASVNRWAVTGTPIQKTVEDLYGLIHFLGLEPYSNQDAWSWLLFVPYVLGNSKPLLDILGKIMWRTEKKDVLDQIDIPPQEIQEIWLDFSEIESFYYKQAHEDKCDIFLEKLRKYDLTSTLGSFDIKTMNSILQPFLSLRQDCTQPLIHNNTQNKQILTMNELLKHLTAAEKLKVEEALRQTVSDMNGIAGLYLLEDDIKNAKIIYEGVLALAEKYEKDFHIDSLLKIHTLHNLYDISTSNRECEISKEVQMYKQRAINLEIRYLGVYYQQVLQVQLEHEKSKNEIDKLYGEFVKPINHWWQAIFKLATTSGFESRLIDRVQCELNNTFGLKVLQDSQWDNVHRFSHNLKTWCAEITDTYNDCLEFVKMVKISDLPKTVDESSTASFMSQPLFRSLTEESSSCHLREAEEEVNKRKRKKQAKKLCRLCQLKKAVDAMEIVMYSMEVKTANWYMNKVRTEGSWKPRAEELVIKSLLSVARSRTIEAQYEFAIQDGETHQKLIEAYKTEFKNLRKFWIKLTDLVAAGDELDICKTRMELNLKIDGEDAPKPSKIPKVLQELSAAKNNPLSNLNIFESHQIPVQKSRLERDRQMHLQTVQRLFNSWNYLNGLKKNYEDMEDNNETCPVCIEPLGKQWAVFTCGHSFCVSCCANLVSQAPSLNVSLTNTTLQQHQSTRRTKCCICRTVQEVSMINYVKLKNDDSAMEEVKIVGNFSTKIQAVLKLILNLKRDDESVKVLIFSQWPVILQYVGKALEKNSILYKVRHSNNPQAVEQFKDPSANITCLLLPLKFGSKGLNLIEATHVILMEPLMNPGEEIQAISRVHRIGQTKKTYVYKFIVRDTIEQNIHYAMMNKWVPQSKKEENDDVVDNDAGEADDDDVLLKDQKDLTLAQLSDLFLNTGNNLAGNYETNDAVYVAN